MSAHPLHLRLTQLRACGFGPRALIGRRLNWFLAASGGREHNVTVCFESVLRERAAVHAIMGWATVPMPTWSAASQSAPQNYPASRGSSPIAFLRKACAALRRLHRGAR